MLSPEYEGVCACSHAQDEHAMGGPCNRCQDPACAFVVLRFHREIVTLPPRWSGPDPVGHYWRLMNPPRGSTAWVFAGLSLEDRSEVASTCFKDAQFDRRGELDCSCGRTNNGLDNCVEEYMCEVIAAFLLMPRGVDLVGKVEDLAAMFDCERWAVRFRRALEANLDPAIGELLDLCETYQAPGASHA